MAVQLNIDADQPNYDFLQKSGFTKGSIAVQVAKKTVTHLHRINYRVSKRVKVAIQRSSTKSSDADLLLLDLSKLTICRAITQKQMVHVRRLHHSERNA